MALLFIFIFMAFYIVKDHIGMKDITLKEMMILSLYPLLYLLLWLN